MRTKARKRVWRVLCIAVIVGLVLSIALPTFAAPGLKMKHQKKFFLDEDSASWARDYIATANVKGLLRGDPDGKFRPNDPLRRAELVTAAIRFMNQERAALGWQGGLEFEDSEEIESSFPWAKGYLAQAAKLSLVSDQERFNPGAQATRLWAAEVLVRALGLQEQAESMMGAVLNFLDAVDVPQDKVGYVAVALANGLLAGYPDGTLKPNQVLTRAELSALLQRADERRGWLRDFEVRGIVKEVVCDDDKWEITLDTSRPAYLPAEDESEPDAGDESETAGSDTNDETSDEQTETGTRNTPGSLPPGVLTFEVSRDALIIVTGKPAGLDDGGPGYHPRLVLNAAGVAVLVEARAAAKPPVPKMRLKGYLVDIPDLEGAEMYGLIPGFKLGILERWAENEGDGEKEEPQDQEEESQSDIQGQGEVNAGGQANLESGAETAGQQGKGAKVKSKAEIQARIKAKIGWDLGKLLDRQDRERERSMLGTLGVLALIPADADVAKDMKENLGQFVVVSGHPLKGPNIYMRPVFKVYEIQKVELGAEEED